MYIIKIVRGFFVLMVALGLPFLAAFTCPWLVIPAMGVALTIIMAEERR